MSIPSDPKLIALAKVSELKAKGYEKTNDPEKLFVLAKAEYDYAQIASEDFVLSGGHDPNSAQYKVIFNMSISRDLNNNDWGALNTLKRLLEIQPSHAQGNALMEEIRTKYPDALKKSGGCFIATACFESPRSPEVELLRNFRDEVLLKSLAGKIFVKIYYMLSPPVARFISRHFYLKKIVRACIITPIVAFISSLWKPN
jgi:hypothetical protein